MQDIVLDICDLSFGYTKESVIFDGFSLSLQRGEIKSVVGRSGSGKSTLFEIIASNLNPQKGQVSRGKIGWIFQDPYSSFHPSYSIVNQIKEVALSLQELVVLCNEVGIELNLLEKLPHELSGGQLQRCSILRAILMEPDLLLCDEPTSALDNLIQLDVMKLLIKRVKNVGILLITHDLDLAKWASDAIISLDRG
ncbi:MAG: ATP-binding cassette domain-containing protein [Campylobacterales bacterium]|nr:ATP-binding cassette domain-containing protein [Campylobacterales bacterium]